VKSRNRLKHDDESTERIPGFMKPALDFFLELHNANLFDPVCGAGYFKFRSAKTVGEVREFEAQATNR
jgi:hypothetical protein